MQQKKEKREEGEEEEEEIEVIPNPITRGLLQPGAPGDIPVCSRTCPLHGLQCKHAFLALCNMSTPTTASWSCALRGAPESSMAEHHMSVLVGDENSFDSTVRVLWKIKVEMMPVVFEPSSIPDFLNSCGFLYLNSVDTKDWGRQICS